MAQINGYTNLSDIRSALKILYFGEVVSVTDDNMMGTLKVRIAELDSNIPTENLPDCYRLSNFMSVFPKIGERVAVLLDRYYMSEKSVNQEKRYWLSVQISTPERYFEDKFYYTASSHETNGFLKIDTPISRIPNARGVYHERNVLGINGRDNSDIILKRGEVLIRAGQHVTGEYTQFNRETTAYIQIKHNEDGDKKKRSRRIVDEVVFNPADYEIRVITDNLNNLSIKIIRYEDLKVIEEYSDRFTNREDMIAFGKAKIKSYQDIYQKWSIKTTDIDFSQLPKIYPNSQITIQKEVDVDTPTSELTKSKINVVAGKINLISHHKDNKFALFDPENQITEQEQERLNLELSPTVKGDLLVEFINLVKSFISNHTHPYHKLPPINDEVVKKIMNFNLDAILNKDIRIS